MRKFFLILLVLSLLLIFSCTDPDTTAPVTSGQVTVDFSGPAYVTWTAATDDVSASADIEYRVYESTSTNISTVDDCLNNGVARSDWIGGTTQSPISWDAETTYYYNVIARDEAGNMSSYTTSPGYQIVL